MISIKIWETRKKLIFSLKNKSKLFKLLNTFVQKCSFPYLYIYNFLIFFTEYQSSAFPT